MPYGICHLSVVPVRKHAENASEMVTQLLYGDHFKILDERKHWSKIRIAFDKTEGWVGNKQFHPLDKEKYQSIDRSKDHRFSSDLVAFTDGKSKGLMPVLLGSTVSNAKFLSHNYEGSFLNGEGSKANLISTAMHYLYAPYLWGGRTPFGIDDAGLTQMVYRINGYKLPRMAADQAREGQPLSFIEESEPGDLAFFDDKEGIINHVGLIMKDNYIIHAHGMVRIDRIDHTGIFNAEERRYTHALRVIKKIL